METENGKPPGSVPVNSNGGGTLDLGEIKRGRGRPPGSTNKAKSDNPGKTRESIPPISDADAEFLSEACVNLLECGDEIIARTLANKIAEVAPEHADEFKRLQADVGLNDKDKKMLRASVSAIAKKYAILGRFGPEILLLVFFGQYGYRQLKLAKFVNEVAEEAQKKRKIKTVEHENN